MRLVLFEIDDTLVCTRGAALAAVVRALQDVYGVTASTDHYAATGKTEPEVAQDLLRRAGLHAEAIAAGAEQWSEALPWALRAELARYTVEVCPGVPELLPALAAQHGVMLGLLTGSLESTAQLKLTAAGLDIETFRIGAFASDDADRRRLPALAVMRAEEVLDRLIMQAEVVVVGASPADVQAARAYGARAVAVATGDTPAAELRRHGPDHVFADLADMERVLAALLD